MSDARDVDAERAGNEAGVVNRAELQAAERTIAKVRALAAYSTDGRGSAIPLDWPEYRAALLALHGDGAELVIELVREAGYMARMIDGHAFLRAPFHGGYVGLPSWLASDELASLAREHFGVDVEPEELWRAMQTLAAETKRRARQRRRTRGRRAA